jgi:hypothetical protein
MSFTEGMPHGYRTVQNGTERYRTVQNDTERYRTVRLFVQQQSNFHKLVKKKTNTLSKTVIVAKDNGYKHYTCD